MKIDISDVARIVAMLPPENRASFDLRVAKLQRDEAAIKAQAIAELRALPDTEVIACAVSAGKAAGSILHDGKLAIDMGEVARVLREAGFVRLAGKEAEMMQAITAGIVSREDAEKMLGVPVTLSPGRVEELPAGTAVTWAAPGENRWEVGLRNIVTILRGPRVEFEISDVVEEVRVMAEGRADQKVDLPEAITRVTEVIREIDFLVSKGHSVSNAPSLRHWLLRGLDALTDENHSGLEPSLPQPKRKLV